ncbi:hypothetical protein SHELI_v1c10240 [Spiroplasma helicoides]|uniref:Lipoprotein n=1 Tax=Spiroplasma helicoides TaxID=216938 RepID=A0A1B3SM04_9MOLU|nr:lipoprotein [Spiroplasma helicoides]AOG60971.1 hypothetical protein SHELI_v1c10240 [Spiroplasma helicoides]
MKKLLSLLAATGLVATSGSVAVACNKKEAEAESIPSKDLASITAKDLSPSANDEASAKTAATTALKAYQAKAKLAVDYTFGTFTAATASDKAGSIVVAAVKDSKLLTGTVTFTLKYVASAEKPEEKHELSSVIKTTELGPITFSGSVPTAEELLAGIKAKNSDASKLTTKDFKIESEPAISATAAKITGQGNTYQGSVSLTYSKAEAPASKKDLSTAVTTKNLDAWQGAADKPTVKEVVDQVNAKNQGLGLTEGDVDMAAPSGSDLTKSATLTAKQSSSKFSGSVTVTYTYTKKAASSSSDAS